MRSEREGDTVGPGLGGVLAGLQGAVNEELAGREWGPALFMPECLREVEEALGDAEGE